MRVFIVLHVSDNVAYFDSRLDSVAERDYEEKYEEEGYCEDGWIPDSSAPGSFIYDPRFDSQARFVVDSVAERAYEEKYARFVEDCETRSRQASLDVLAAQENSTSGKEKRRQAARKKGSSLDVPAAKGNSMSGKVKQRHAARKKEAKSAAVRNRCRKLVSRAGVGQLHRPPQMCLWQMPSQLWVIILHDLDRKRNSVLSLLRYRWSVTMIKMVRGLFFLSCPVV